MALNLSTNRVKRKFTLATMTLAVFALVAQPLVALNIPSVFAVAGNNNVVINEVSLEGEWVELYGPANHDVSGWVVQFDANDSTSQKKTLAASATLDSNGFLAVDTGASWLNNSGDTVKLWNGTTKEDEQAIPNHTDAGSYGRTTDGSATWQDFATATKGAVNNPTATSGPVKNVEDNLTYPTIQAAVDAADTNDGETLEVSAGDYAENAVVTKSLTIKGAQAGVDARSRSAATETVLNGGFNVTSPNVTIDGFTFTGSTSAVVTNQPNTKLVNNIVTNTGSETFQVNADNGTVASNVTIEQNKFSGGYIDINFIGNKLIKATGFVVKNNTSFSNRSFLGIANTQDAVVTGNVVDTVSETGISIVGGNDNLSITQNTIQNAKSPIRLTNDFIDAGPQYSANSNVTIQFNNLLGTNADGGDTRAQARSYTAGQFVDMTKNWWGSANGPYDNDNANSNPVTNPNQTDSTVSKVFRFVDYSSWLCQPFGEGTRIAVNNKCSASPVVTSVTPAKGSTISGTAQRIDIDFANDNDVRTGYLQLNKVPAAGNLSNGNRTNYLFQKDENGWYVVVDTKNIIALSGGGHQGDGNYRFKIEAHGFDGVPHGYYGNGASWNSSNFYFTVDNTNPWAELKTTSKGNIAQKLLQEADVALRDNAKIVAYIINGTRVPVSSATTKWSDANDIKVGSRHGVYGENELKVEDAAGNISEPLTFILDNVAPKATVNDRSVGTDSTFSKVFYDLFDTYKIDKVTINDVEKDLSDNKWSNVDGIVPGKFGAREGENTLVVYDVAGNSSEYTFTLDITAPTGEVSYDNTAPINGNVIAYITTLEPVTISNGWEATDDTNTRFKHKFTDNGSFDATITDAAGNSTKLTATVNWIDTTAPSFNIENGQVFTTDTVEVVVTEANVNVVKLDDETVTLSEGNKLTVTGEGRYTVVVTDTAGNSRSVTFTIDTTPPVLSNVNVSGTGSERTISGTTEPGAKVFLSVNGTIYELVASENGSWSQLIDVSTFTYGVAYPYSVYAEDAYGNEGVPQPGNIVVPNPGARQGVPEVSDTENTLNFQANRVAVATTPEQLTTSAVDTESDIRGAQDTAKVGTDTAVLAASDQGWKLFGTAWYWWLLVVAALAGVWWFIAGLRRRRQAEETL